MGKKETGRGRRRGRVKKEKERKKVEKRKEKEDKEGEMKKAKEEKGEERYDDSHNEQGLGVPSQMLIFFRCMDSKLNCFK